MLELFRRYQKFLFIIVTVVVVISFSFYGTYSLFTGHEMKDDVAFEAVDGSLVMRSELNDLITLISTSHSPFQQDVITDDILNTPIGMNLIDSYLPEMQSELQSRFEKEKRYTPYVHPEANFLSAEQVWTYFAPDVKRSYDALKGETNPATAKAFEERINLFLAEKQFPPEYLKYFLRYQEAQHKELAEDPDLGRLDMAIFGYHTVQDWFGPKFVELVATFIINSAKLAEKEGKSISREEVLASLLENAHQHFKERLRKQRDGMAVFDNFQDYYQAELRKIGMDQARLMKAWTDVLLFRRLFMETRDAVLVSDIPYKDFYRYLGESAEVTLYKLPKELVTKNDRELARLELYFTAIGDPKSKVRGEKSLLLPTKTRTLADIQKVYPELVQKRYVIKYAVCTNDDLQAKSSLRYTWQWETDASNFRKLAEKFPELDRKKPETLEEREAVLDGLNPKLRMQVDNYSRMLLVREHPEWLKEVLADAPLQEKVIYFREQGGKMPLQGIVKRKELMQLLDSVPLSSENPALFGYTQDKVNFYRIIVIDRDEKPQLLTLKESLADGTLDQLLDKTLEASYPRQRSQKPGAFVKEDGELKSFQEVKDQLVDGAFPEFFQRLDREVQEVKAVLPEFYNWSDKQGARSAVRFYAAAKEAKEKLQIAPNDTSWLFDKERAARDPISEQFAWSAAREEVIRGKEAAPVDIKVAFNTPVDTVSAISFSPKSGVGFFKVLKNDAKSADEAIVEKVFEQRDMIGDELEGQYTRNIVRLMQAKKPKAKEAASK